jgi:hypothetical protein
MEILNQLPLCFTELLLRPARLIESDVLASELEARIYLGFWRVPLLSLADTLETKPD